MTFTPRLVGEQARPSPSRIELWKEELGLDGGCFPPFMFSFILMYLESLFYKFTPVIYFCTVNISVFADYVGIRKMYVWGFICPLWVGAGEVKHWSVPSHWHDSRLAGSKQSYQICMLQWCCVLFLTANSMLIIAFVAFIASKRWKWEDKVYEANLMLSIL